MSAMCCSLMNFVLKNVTTSNANVFIKFLPCSEIFGHEVDRVIERQLEDELLKLKLDSSLEFEWWTER